MATTNTMQSRSQHWFRVSRIGVVLPSEVCVYVCVGEFWVCIKYPKLNLANGASK